MGVGCGCATAVGLGRFLARKIFTEEGEIVVKHANIPIFIPHRGCLNACVFCNQHTISGALGDPAPEMLPVEARTTIETALSTISPDTVCEIAYFGGSFTGIDPDLMEALLALAAEYVAAGRVSSIRFSTRPDYVGDAVLDRIAPYPIGTIELGVQSLSDTVLSVCRRGHTAADALSAIARLRGRGYAVVGQMMLGLPVSTFVDERETAQRLIDAGVSAVRIYPTLVLRGTRLAEMSATGEYGSLSLDEAILRTAELLDLFDRAGVEVLRVGLQETDGLREPNTVLAGPCHPAFGELAMGECFYRRAEELFGREMTRRANVTIAVPHGRTSAMIGQKKKNLSRLCAKFGMKTIKVVEIDTLLGYNIKIVHNRKEE